jgi:hypothetical protein
MPQSTAAPQSYPTTPLPSVAPPSANAPWYKRKGFIIAGSIVGALLVIGGISSAVSPKDKGTPAAASSTIKTTSPAPAAVAPVTTSTKPTPSQPKVTTHAAPPVVHTTADSASDGSFAMPNEVGEILQAAQDDLQRVSGNPIYISGSHDLLGSRHQVLDGNWQVCDQNVAPGVRVTDAMSIDFGVVKVDEACP